MNNPSIIDVRTPDEFMEEHLEGSINIPYVEIPDRLDEIRKLQLPILICCETGDESKQVTAYLKSEGITCENGGLWFELENKI